MFTIAQKLGRVLVAGTRTVNEAEPVVEAMFGRGGVVAIVYRHTEVPLPKVSGGIAVFLKHFGDGRFAFQQMHLVKPFGDDRINSGAIVVAARKEGGARGGTTRRSRVKVGKTNAPSG